MNNWPQEIRQVDLPGLVKGLQEVMGPAVAGNEMVNVGGIEALFQLFERFVPLLEKSSQAIMNMRAFEARSQPQGVVDSSEPDEDGWHQGEVWVDDAPAEAPRREPRQQAAPAKVDGLSAGQIEPQKVYAAILETMAQLPGEMTIGSALQMAREQKELILANIATELGKL